VPFVPKFADADVATETLPDALTLDCTVPCATVAVRWEPVDADDPPRNP
jgi:hypothetical protein